MKLAQVEQRRIVDSLLLSSTFTVISVSYVLFFSTPRNISLPIFRSRLKTHLFIIAFPP